MSNYFKQVLDIVVYLHLLAVGLYFIYHGNIFQRFLKGRTQFAEFEEDITELPTILTYIEFKKTPITPLKYGSDFNISFKIVGQGNPTILSPGDNDIHKSLLKLRLEDQNEFSTNLKQSAEKRQHFKVTPLNFPTGLLFEFDLKYIFKSTIDAKSRLLRTGFDLTSENNSFCGGGYHDGEEKDRFAQIGERARIFVKPEKYMFQEGHEMCRDKPYNDILYRNIATQIALKCNIPCRHPNYWQCSYVKYIADLPICKNHTESQCFIEVRDQEKKNIPLKPCTKLQYKLETELWPHPHKNEAEIGLKFVSPFKVKVKEEFFIFDMVSVISAIGGTLGLCTGFSFRHLYGWLCQLIMLGFKKVTPSPE